MISDSHTIRSNGISATVKAAGAELCSLKNVQELELLWQAGPEWPRHAPLLFPIVGRLKNDELRHGGKVFPMTQQVLLAIFGSIGWTVAQAPASWCLPITRKPAPVIPSHFG